MDEAIDYRVRIYDEDATPGIDIPLEEYDPWTPGETILGVPALSDMLVAGAGIVLTPDTVAGTVEVASSITQYTDEAARDALGTALTAGPGITITPNDGADTITVSGVPIIQSVASAATVTPTFAIGVGLPATTVISKTLYLGMIFNSADTKWDVIAVAQEA
jgi:hypothetical protein